jgi:hypothetical protein
MPHGFPDYAPFEIPLLPPGGGTGISDVPTDNLLVGRHLSPLGLIAAGAADQVLRVPGGGGTPAFGAVDLAKAAAVSGLLPVVRGGSGTATPSLVAGQDINVSGSWPGQTIAAVITLAHAVDVLAVAHGGWGSLDGTFDHDIKIPTESIIVGGTATKQISGGPEMISYQYAAGVRVWEAMFVGSDFNARMLVDDVAGAGFELGPGGSGAFSDQDTSIRRWDADGTLKLITNREVEVARSDAPGGIRLSISVNPWSDGTLTSDGTQPSDGDTVTIGTTVYTFKTILGAAYDVKIGATIYATLTNLKAAINADGTPGVNYGAGTAANPVALVAYSWRNDTTLLYFHVHGSVCGTNVATASSTAHLVWSSNPLTRLVCMARVNGFAEYGYGALDVHHIGVDIPTVRISQAGVAGALISGYVDGDAQSRFYLQADGTMTWGPGSATGDITFVRTGVAAVKFQGLGGNDSVTGFQILRANANPVLNVDTLNTRVGIGTAAPTSPLHAVGLPVYPDNAAAVAAGLTAGAFYRTNADPDPVAVVH